MKSLRAVTAFPLAPERKGCPCGCRAEQEEIGPLPGRVETFGGCPLPTPFTAGSLWHCTACDLRYRFPYLSQPELEALYAKVPLEVWTYQQPPKRWNLISQFASAAKGKKLLDVGCFSGEFLSWLPEQWERYGVEPSQKAAELAAQKGIRVLARNLFELPANAGPFDCIVMSDVIEHVREPLGLFHEAAKHLSDGGILIILTGTSDAFWPRVFGRYYWYINLSEHVVWLSRRWMKFAAKQTGLQLEDMVTLTQADSRVHGPRHVALACIYWAATQVAKVPWLHRIASRIKGYRTARSWSGPPWLLEATDHMLVSFRKRGRS